MRRRLARWSRLMTRPPAPRDSSCTARATSPRHLQSPPPSTAPAEQTSALATSPLPFAHSPLACNRRLRTSQQLRSKYDATSALLNELHVPFHLSSHQLPATSHQLPSFFLSNIHYPL